MNCDNPKTHFPVLFWALTMQGGAFSLFPASELDIYFFIEIQAEQII